MSLLSDHTFTKRFGAVPGAILGADESGSPVGVHGESRGTLETDSVVVCEIRSKSHPIGRYSGITTVDN